MRNTTFYIEEGEFYFLLAALGQKTFFGISSKEKGMEESWSKKEQIYRLLVSLYQKEYVDLKDDMIYLQEPVKSILEELMQATHMRLIQREKGRIAYYKTEQGYIRIEKSLLEKEMLKITAVEEILKEDRKRGHGIEKRIHVFTGEEYDID